MNIRNKRGALLAGGVAVAIAAAVSVTIAVTSSSASTAEKDTKEVKKANAQYKDVAVAKRDGFGELKDTKGIACIDDPAGGMGIHYVNGDRVKDATENATAPELVIYEPQKNGTLKLVAVEYVVVKADWTKAGHSAPPSLFGRQFSLVHEGNRYGLPDFYELHAWIFEKNSRGMFDDWNPKVSCANA
ncbi:MAG: hypothetical protein QOG53_242 [Frankiales bacterium]|jgi:hypothetical protein|nr:hypothetical protein [Frankiales bacterium]